MPSSELVPAVAGIPVFRLQDVVEFRARGSAQVADVSLDRVEQKEILPGEGSKGH